MATPADVEEIVRFDSAAQRGSRRVALIRRSIDASHCFVCCAEQAIAAYGVLDYSFYDNGFIPVLSVHPDQRRRGVGTRLMRHMESVCETEKLFTSTNLSNLPMQALLSKLGYRLSGFIENLDPGDPELVYFKQLSRST